MGEAARNAKMLAYFGERHRPFTLGIMLEMETSEAKPQGTHTYRPKKNMIYIGNV
jgi:hypothetical protein